MRKFFFVSAFLLANYFILVVFIFLLTFQLAGKGKVLGAETESPALITTSYDIYTAVPQNSFETESEIVAGDARGKLIDNFFSRYHSPMSGLGSEIVSAADKYSLPFGLLPAIAQCEGNLGKKAPEDSFNTWGWAIYGDKVTRFSSWNDGIQKVSSGLRNDYFNKGLTTPETIMKKYTPSSNGSWSDCVNQFLEELR